MSTNNIKLVDEDNNEIIGVELSNGELGKIKFVDHVEQNVRICTLPNDIKENTDGTNNFHLSNGSIIRRELSAITDSSEHYYIFPPHLFPKI